MDIDEYVNYRYIPILYTDPYISYTQILAEILLGYMRKLYIDTCMGGHDICIQRPLECCEYDCLKATMCASFGMHNVTVPEHLYSASLEFRILICLSPSKFMILWLYFVFQILLTTLKGFHVMMARRCCSQPQVSFSAVVSQ